MGKTMDKAMDIEFAEKQQKLVWAAIFRFVAIFLTLFAIVLFFYFGLLFYPRVASVVILLYLLANCGAYYFFRKGLHLDLVTNIIITIDIIVLTIIIYLTGGLLSPIIIGYILQASGTALHANYRLSVIMSMLSIMLYSTLLGWTYFEVIPYLGPEIMVGDLPIFQSVPHIVMSIVALSGFLSLITYSTGQVASKIKIKEKELEKLNVDLLALYEIGTKVSGFLKIDEILNSMLEGIANKLGYSRLKLFLAMGGKLQEKTYPSNEDRTDWQVDEKALNKVIQEKNPQLAIRPLSNKKNFLQKKILRRKDRYSVHLFSPLIVKDKLEGVVAVGTDTVGQPEPSMIRTLETLTHQIAAVLESAQLYEKIELLSITDGLTGLFNRRHFGTKLTEDISRARRYDYLLSLIMIDIDHFKKVNDTYGHPQGDIVLKEIAELLKKDLRAGDVAARYGGEEFVVIYPYTDTELAAVAAERLRTLVEKHPFPGQDSPLKVTISLGVATFPSQEVTDEDSLISQADKQLYKAKYEGRNRVCHT
ncbi:MAG: putative diguanylate cyclase YcdT [Syntrophomonadaceae bacterium]|nr:putative diguanylate cyclase YcdT [Bacillota bacterium]